MSLCRLVVEDFFDYTRGNKLTMFKVGYDLYDLIIWKEYAEVDIENGKSKNWWCEFDNKVFLKFIDKMIKKIKGGRK